MASIRELRTKIKSVKSTQQITKAMKMVAAARLNRAQNRIVSARPFAEKNARPVTRVGLPVSIQRRKRSIASVSPEKKIQAA